MQIILLVPRKHAHQETSGEKATKSGRSWSSHVVLRDTHVDGPKFRLTSCVLVYNSFQSARL